MRVFFGSTAGTRLKRGTALEGGLVVSLSKNGVVVAERIGDRDADLLALLERVLKDAKVKKTSLKEIVVDRGPDGFSAVRRRVALATGLARALGMKIAAIDPCPPWEAAALPGDAFSEKLPISPLYLAAPNITRSKRPKTWNAR